MPSITGALAFTAAVIANRGHPGISAGLDPGSIRHGGGTIPGSGPGMTTSEAEDHDQRSPTSGRPDNLLGRTSPISPSPQPASFTFQTSSQYSRIARSEENQPTPAVLKMLERHQAA